MTHRTHLALVVAAMLAAATVPALAEEGAEFRGGQWQESVQPQKGSMEGELALVRSYVDHGQYRQAVSAAQRFVKFYHDPAAREEVLMLAGEAEMNRGRLLQAYEWFEKQLAEFAGGHFSGRRWTTNSRWPRRSWPARSRLCGASSACRPATRG